MEVTFKTTVASSVNCYVCITKYDSKTAEVAGRKEKMTEVRRKHSAGKKENRVENNKREEGRGHRVHPASKLEKGVMREN